MGRAIKIRKDKVGGLQIVESPAANGALCPDGCNTRCLVEYSGPVEQGCNGHGIDFAVDFEGISIGNQHTDVVSTEAFGFEFPAEVVVQRLCTDHRPVGQQGHIVLHPVTLGDQLQQTDFATANSQAIDRLRSWGGYAQD